MSVMGTKEIMAILAHRYPMLLIDTIEEIGDEMCIAKKNVTANEPVFTGHFPGEPIFPGVLILEAMGQTGGIYLAEMTGFDKENQVTMFMGIDKAKFRKPVLPGDTMYLKTELVQDKKMRNGHIVKFQGTAIVNDEVRATAILTAGIFNKE